MYYYVLLYTAIYNTIQYNTIQNKTIQYNTIHCNTIQHNPIQYNTIQYNTIQSNTIQYNPIQYNTIRYNTMFYPPHFQRSFPVHGLVWTMLSSSLKLHSCIVSTLPLLPQTPRLEQWAKNQSPEIRMYILPFFGDGTVERLAEH